MTFTDENLHKIIAAVLAVFLLCGLTACGEDETANSECSSAAEVEELAEIEPRMISGDELPLGAEIALKIENEITNAVVVNWAETPTAVNIYAEPNAENVIGTTEAGEDFVYEETDDPMWYKITTRDGGDGYIYGEEFYRVDGDEAASVSLARESVEAALDDLREKLPDGKYWNHIGTELAWGEESPFIVTDTPCNNNQNGTLYCNFYNGTSVAYFSYDKLCQCLGFASLLSDEVFGESAPVHIYYDPKLLRVGDHIRLREYEHSMTVTEITDEYITVAEVNANYNDCKISWSTQLSMDELHDIEWDAEYISRYPLCPDGEGGFTEWKSE